MTVPGQDAAEHPSSGTFLAGRCSWISGGDEMLLDRPLALASADGTHGWSAPPVRWTTSLAGLLVLHRRREASREHLPATLVGLPPSMGMWLPLPAAARWLLQGAIQRRD